MREVDTREPWEIIQENLLATGWERKQLNSGDFRWEAHDSSIVGATRKTTVDLLGSIGASFGAQLEEMLDIYPICIFIHEKSPNVIWSHQTDELMSRAGNDIIRHPRLSVANWLHSFQAKGFIMERTNSPQETVQRLNELYVLYQKPYSRSAQSRRYRDDRILALCSGLRGKKGEALLSQYSLKEIYSMSVDDLQDEPGIGLTLAKRQYSHANRSNNT